MKIELLNNTIEATPKIFNDGRKYELKVNGVFAGHVFAKSEEDAIKNYVIGLINGQIMLGKIQ